MEAERRSRSKREARVGIRLCIAKSSAPCFGSDDLLPPAVSFCAVLDLRFCYRLPLHIGRGISATTFERNDVIRDVTLPALRIALRRIKSARAEALRLILPLRLRLATVDFFGTDDLRDRVEVVLGFDDVLRDRVDEDRAE